MRVLVLLIGALGVHETLKCAMVQVLSDGHVYFTNEGKQRPSAEAALQHHFLAPAFQPDLSPEEFAEGAALGSDRPWLGLFSLVQNRVTDLEDEISRTVRYCISSRCPICLRVGLHTIAFIRHCLGPVLHSLQHSTLLLCVYCLKRGHTCVMGSAVV